MEEKTIEKELFAFMRQEEILAQMKMDLELRNRSKDTIRDYLRHVKAYQDYYGKPADEMGEEEMRGYLHYLRTARGNMASTVNTRGTAIRFVYDVTLDIAINYKRVPRMKERRSIPVLPDKSELQKIFNAAPNLKYRSILMLMYGSGLRISEVANLKVMDIDSKQMRIFIRKGKGGKDRFALLPEKTLYTLREYYKLYKPQDWLFWSRKKKQLSIRTIQDGVKRSVKDSGVEKHITAHTFRHCFATHLMNEGKNIFEIKMLLGHAYLDSTAWYLQLAQSDALKLSSPIDTMSEEL